MTKKKTKKRTPSYCKHAPSGQAVVTLQGKVFYLGRYESRESWKKYDALIAEYLANGRELPPTRSETEITVEELAVKFIEWAEGYYVKNGKPTDSASRANLSLRPVVRYYGKNVVSEFGTLSLKFVRDKMIEGGLARKTINNRVTVIKHCFKWGVENELVPVETWQALTAVTGLKKGRSAAVDREPVAPVAWNIVEKTMLFMCQMIADMVHLQYLMACRPGEIRLVRGCDIKRAGDIWIYTPNSHKTEHHGRGREIPFGQRAHEILAKYLLRKADDPTAYLFSPADAETERIATMRANRKTNVQPSQQDRSKKNPKRKPGKMWTRSSYLNAIKKACRRAGVACWTPLQLRHTRATEIRKRYGLEAAQIILGHAKADVTQIYAERDLAKGIEVMKEIG
jgi:integrase